ncbi:hybrid sensor histidine kinase/response regulator [Noviherbaspirillum soli]|uniref:hybrid sensor histidine kinase/response regulator n=1 Tax=Noviherbaspirillum soli TaxID=1064518 RepID=UPI00188ABFD2|nr:ATP-binding protein [Noviherbaspirillum soli]
MKVRTHLNLIAAAILLPVALFSGLALDQILKGEREAVLRSMNEAARATSLAVDREWSYAEGSVFALSSSVSLATDDLAGFYAQAKAANRREVMHTALLNDAGQQLLNTAVPFGTSIASPSPAARERVNDVLATSVPKISNLIIGRATGKPVVTIELPVTVAGGKRYVISQWLYAEDLNRAFPSEGVPSSWLIGIFDRDGTTIARNRGPQHLVGKPPKEDLLQAILTGNQTYIRNQSRDGLELYTVLARSPQSGWTVAVGVPALEVEATARKAVILTASGLLVAVGIAILGAILFSRRLVEAIDKNTRAATLLGLGKAPPVTPTYVDEVDRVQLALHSAGAALQQHEHERNALLTAAQEARALAEQQNHAKDDFLAMLGHELRNPLSAIRAGVSLIECYGITPAADKKARDVIKRQTDQLCHIVDALLDASRVMTGKIILSKQRLDLGEATQACLSAFQARGIAAQYVVETDIASVWVDADPTRIAQVINNLLENAFKYTPEGGRVALYVGADGAEAVLRLCDSGVGIRNELLPRIFDVFVQAPASLDRAKGGLGIGLAVVNAMVRQHAGSVTAASGGEDKGSCFEVRLPLATGAAGIEISPPHEPAAQKGIKILLVDDNEDALEMLAQLLLMQGFDVLRAASGEEGVRLALAELPDCAIVDIGLPDIDGYQVVRRLRSNTQTAAMRLIALTGYSQETDRQRAHDAGFDVHLSKPVDIARLAKDIVG